MNRVPVYRSLADDIRSRSDAQLRDLILARPDLARPAPEDLTALAARAVTGASVRRAVERLDTGHLHVLRASGVIGGVNGPVEPDAVAALLGATVDGHLERLWAQALLWRSLEGLRMVRAVAESLGRSPAGPGAPWRQLSPAGGPAGGPGARGGRADPPALDPPALDPPALEVSTPGLDVVDAGAGERIRTILHLLDDLAHAWASDPPRVLRSGGLSVRDLARVADRLDVGVDQAAWLVEVAHAAGLVGDDGGPTSVFLPTAELDAWSGRTAGRRWATVTRGWYSSTRAAHLVGSAGRSGPVNALGPDASWPPIRAVRAEVLGMLARTEPGAGVSGARLVARLVWNHPLRDPAPLATSAEAVLREAHWLGVLAVDGLSGPGRALLQGAAEPTLAAAADGVLPPEIDQVLLQADLTVVAPGPVGTELTRFLRLVADVESRGGATVWRFRPESIRRALDSGLTADEVLATLARSSRTPVPQPLDYLVRDVARRHGHTRVGSATAYLRSDDEAALAAIRADRSLAPALLRRIAPTVLVAHADPADLIDLLREAGYAPVQEAMDGSIVVAEPGRRRARRQARQPADLPAAAVDTERAAAIVAALRAAPSRTGPAADPTTAADPAVTMATVHELAESGSAAWIGYADGNGRTVRRLVRVEGVEGGRVRVVDETSGRAQVLLLHRITGAGPAPRGRQRSPDGLGDDGF